MMNFFLNLIFTAILTTFCLNASAEDKNNYKVLVLGDIHYDALDLRVQDPGKNASYLRNINAWKKNIPDMLQAAADRANKECAFAIQCGDITQGDEGSYEFSVASFNRVLEQVDSRFQIPLHFVRGNHDVRGIGKRKASDEILAARIEKQNLNTIEKSAGTTCYKVIGKDLFLFYDSEADSLGTARAILKKHPGMRHIFLVTHLPVVPCLTSHNMYWLCYWKKPEKQEALRKLLAKHNVIVLSAHTHLTANFKWDFPEGSIRQFTSYSIANPNSALRKIETGDTGEFFKLTDAFLAKKDLPEAIAKKQLLCAKTLPGYRNAKVHFNIYKWASGFNVLRIKGDEVYMDIHTGKDYKNPVHTVRLK